MKLRPVTELVKENEYQKVVEVGVHTGFTMRQILLNCPSVTSFWAVDPWAPYDSVGRLPLIKDPLYWSGIYDEVVEEFDSDPRVRIMRVPSLKAAKTFNLGFLDLVFIDADHTTPAVSADIKAWLPLIRVGGMLTGHDYPKGTVKVAVDQSLTEFDVRGTTWYHKIGGGGR